MKTIFSKTLIVAVTLLAGLFLPGKILAQPFPVNNHLGCPINIKIDVFQQGFQPGHEGPCYHESSATATIPPGGTFLFPITVAPSYRICDIIVTVTDVDGISIPPLSSNLSSPPVTGPGAGCAPMLTINVSPGGADVN